MNSITKIELPATRTELLMQSEPMRPRDLFYAVWDIHLWLYEKPEYQQYLDAYTKDQAAEGSIAADEFMAANMVREYAEEHSIFSVQSAKLHDIVKALRRAMKKGNIARKQRRELAALLAAAEAANQAAGEDGA